MTPQARLLVVGDACAGSSDDDRERARRVVGPYAPLVHVVTGAEVVAGR